MTMVAGDTKIKFTYEDYRNAPEDKRYERHGVLEYLLVDLIAETVNVLMLGEQSFELAAIYGEGQPLTSPTPSGFVLDLKEVF